MSRHRRIVQVTGSGKATATPDVVRLALGVTCDGDDVSSALRLVGERVQAIGTASRSQDVRAGDISSTGAGVHPRYDRDGQRVVGYQAFHRLGVMVRDVDGVAGVAGNSLSVDSIQLDLSDVSALQDEARSAAFLDARAKAGQYAALSDAALGEVLSVIEGAVAGGGPRPMMAMAMAARDSAMPVEAGEQTVTATVTVTWALDGSSAGDADRTAPE